MRAWLLKLADLLPRNFWFLPSLMMLGAIGLYLFADSVDQSHLSDVLQRYGIVYAGSLAQARTILSVIAETMIAIASLTFTTVVVVLTLASGQFGHRLVRSFMHDKLTQCALGMFVTTFVYSVLVLHSSQPVGAHGAAPPLTISIAFYLAIASGAMLVYFTHHISQMIAAPSVIFEVGTEIDATIDRTYPALQNHRSPPVAGAMDEILEQLERHGAAVAGTATGYIQTLDMIGLIAAAAQCDATVELTRRPGDYLYAGSVVARIWPANRRDALAAKIRDSMVVGPRRTPVQDLRFAFNQLAEIAVRAMSPALNDPFTAMDCVNRIGAGISRLAQQAPPSAYQTDAGGKLRLVIRPVTFTETVHSALTPVRNYSRESVIVTLQMLHALQELAPLLCDEGQRAAIAEQATLIRRGADAGLAEAADRQVVQAEYEIAMRLLGAAPAIKAESAPPWHFRDER